MTEFKVVNIVDGDTFDVDPGWKWNGDNGKRIRPAGYDAAELGRPLDAFKRIFGGPSDVWNLIL